MGYVIAGVLVLLIITGFITFLVMNSMKKNDLSDAGDPGADQNPLGIIGSDEDSPLGDTTEHAGEQNERGETVGHQDAERHGGTGTPRERYGSEGAPQERFDRAPSDDPEVARPVVGGEAEGERSAH
jgi:hypothetical protein